MPQLTNADPTDERSNPWPSRIIGITLILGYVVAIEWLWGWGQILDQWQNWSTTEFISVVFLILVTYLIRAIRIWEYFRQESQVKLLNCVKLTLFHNLANNLLPMRSGEASFPLLMRAYFDLPMSRTTGTLLWFRFLDLLVVLLLGAGAWIYMTEAHSSLWIVWLVCLASPLLIVSLQDLLVKIVLDRIPQGKISDLVRSVLSGMPQDMGALLRSLTLTWINWSLKLGVFSAVVLVFTDMGVLGAFIGALVGELSSILPIHAPGGIGTYEAGVVLGATAVGESATQALQGGVNLHIVLILTTLIGGLLALPLPGKSRAR